MYVLARTYVHSSLYSILRVKFVQHWQFKVYYLEREGELFLYYFSVIYVVGVVFFIIIISVIEVVGAGVGEGAVVRSAGRAEGSDASERSYKRSKRIFGHQKIICHSMHKNVCLRTFKSIII